MAFEDNLTHIQFAKRGAKIGVADVLVGVHHDNEALSLEEPGRAGTEQIVQESLSRANVKTPSPAKIS